MTSTKGRGLLTRKQLKPICDGSNVPYGKTLLNDVNDIAVDYPLRKKLWWRVGPQDASKTSA